MVEHSPEDARKRGESHHDNVREGNELRRDENLLKQSLLTGQYETDEEMKSNQI